MSAPVVDRRARLDPDAVAAVVALAGRAADADGVVPFNEVTRALLADPGDAEVLHAGVHEDGGLVGALVAHRDGDAWQGELVVEPHHRRRGAGTALVRDLLDAVPADATVRLWAHGDLPGAAPLARSTGLAPARTLLRLTRDGLAPVEEPAAPDGVRVRTFVPGQDEDALITTNGRAFAAHPEQAHMDAADLARRTGSDWFDPEGLFLVEDAGDGRLLAFHWTKVVDAVGEVYVVGVDPDAQGRGLGRFVTALGLHHLTTVRGLGRVDLYVEGDNDPALATYRRQGFVEAARDVLYRR